MDESEDVSNSSPQDSPSALRSTHVSLADMEAWMRRQSCGGKEMHLLARDWLEVGFGSLGLRQLRKSSGSPRGLKVGLPSAALSGRAACGVASALSQLEAQPCSVSSLPVLASFSCVPSLNSPAACRQTYRDKGRTKSRAHQSIDSNCKAKAHLSTRLK